ncbi:MAG: hypothetical protein PHO15_01935 [Eubacteriales bacterium]|nr:hypothetical protein [Eubacteriales bacterium]
MYCKKCGKEYPNNRKTCKECGIILSPGASPIMNKKRNRRMVIIGGAVFAVIVAVFLIIGLTGKVPSELKGTWYDTTGWGGMLDFKPSGVVIHTLYGEESENTYTFDSALGQGVITATDSDGTTKSNFTCDGTTIDMDGVVFTKEYVEQYDFNDLFGELVD